MVLAWLIALYTYCQYLCHSISQAIVPVLYREGKSGQQRATHRLTAGPVSITLRQEDSATENNYLAGLPGDWVRKGENVR
jgi:hypothetical protein